MPNLLDLPIEILDKIVEMSEDISLIDFLPVSRYLYSSMKWKDHTLIYGPVQSGKTTKLIECLKETSGLRVLVIQNSKSVLDQYKRRFAIENISYIIVPSKGNFSIDYSSILVIMNNKYRKNNFEDQVKKERITPDYVIYDEADLTAQTQLNCHKSIFCTATPFKMKINFSHMIVVKPSEDYIGIEDLYLGTPDQVKKDFLTEGVTSLMLVVVDYKVKEMKRMARGWSKNLKNTPVLLYCHQKIIFYRGRAIPTKQHSSISFYIDNFPEKAIIVSNRLAMRGLSFVSSDYKRHLTHQIIKVKSNLTNFLQSLRILGKYKVEKDEKNPYIGIYDCDIDLYINHLKKLCRYKRLFIQEA
jgi:hypothetical protein